MTADHATDRTADQAADRSPDHQKTIREPVSFTGVGLHTGTTTTITFRPAPPGSGIRFVRTDLPGRPEIQVRPENARHDTRQLRRTIIAHGAAEVHTVEHVLSTVAGLGLDNLILEVDGMEAPEAVDGSARSLVALVRSAGVVDQGVPRDYLVLREPVSFQDDGIQILGIPHDGLRISFTIQYENPLVGTQYRSIEITPEVYAREIAPARTFALFEEVAMLREAGMIKGGTLENAVVVQGDRILNEDGLRFPDEFVRHKILDLLGDLTLWASRCAGTSCRCDPGMTATSPSSSRCTSRWGGRTGGSRAAAMPTISIGSISTSRPSNGSCRTVIRSCWSTGSCSWKSASA